MRILMTTDTIGGVWTFTQELASGLLQEGCSVCLVSFGGPPSASQHGWLNETQHRWNERFFFEDSEIPLEWMEDNERAYRDAAPLLLRMAEEFSPVLLHSNQLCFGALPLAIPKVVTAHSDVLSWAESCRGGPLEDSGWLRRYRSLAADGLTNADSIVAPTRWMADALARNFARHGTVLVIPNGRSIPLPQLSVTKKLQAVTAGRLWDEAKNVALLRDVRSPMPLFVAGEARHGSSTIPDELGDAAPLGPQSQSELLQLFCESAIYICTSRYEPFGLAPLEAALCECAILANDIPSLREVWQKGAIYFSGAQQLSRLLYELYRDGDRLRAAQDRAFQRARYFNVERMIEQYLQIYRQALSRTEEASYVS
jgi:glycosyltransferase involved in cell wall biosynthesis